VADFCDCEEMQMTRLVKNAKIATMDSGNPQAEAAVIVGDFFAYVGTEEGAEQYLAERGMSVEDVEKVCYVVKLFIETGQVAANKDLCIPLNKKLRNAELNQFVYNIIRYNGKDYLDGDSFLQTAFCEWFSGKKENIAKNYSVLPKDSLVSKDGVEADLERLRKLIDKELNSGKWVRIVDSQL